MKRYLLWMGFLVPFFKMFSLYAVDDDGVGGDIGDFEIDDDDIEPKAVEKHDNLPDLSGKLAALEAFREETEREKAVISVVSDLQKVYPEFDITKVATHLKGLSEAERERLNNPIGWENIHLKHFARSGSKIDPFDPGSGAAHAPFDLDDTYNRMRGGDKRALRDLYRNAK